MAKRKAKAVPPPQLVSRPTKGSADEAMREAATLSRAQNVRKVEIRFLNHGYYQTVVRLTH
jgi:hypothetical protein